MSDSSSSTKSTSRVPSVSAARSPGFLVTDVLTTTSVAGVSDRDEVVAVATRRPSPSIFSRIDELAQSDSNQHHHHHRYNSQPQGHELPVAESAVGRNTSSSMIFLVHQLQSPSMCDGTEVVQTDESYHTSSSPSSSTRPEMTSSFAATVCSVSALSSGGKSNSVSVKVTKRRRSRSRRSLDARMIPLSYPLMPGNFTQSTDACLSRAIQTQQPLAVAIPSSENRLPHMSPSQQPADSTSSSMSGTNYHPELGLSTSSVLSMQSSTTPSISSTQSFELIHNGYGIKNPLLQARPPCGASFSSCGEVFDETSGDGIHSSLGEFNVENEYV